VLATFENGKKWYHNIKKKVVGAGFILLILTPSFFYANGWCHNPIVVAHDTADSTTVA
jgi:hypothetical protein